MKWVLEPTMHLRLAVRVGCAVSMPQQMFKVKDAETGEHKFDVWLTLGSVMETEDEQTLRGKVLAMLGKGEAIIKYEESDVSGNK